MDKIGIPIGVAVGMVIGFIIGNYLIFPLLLGGTITEVLQAL